MRSLVRNRCTWRREGTVAAVVCAVAFGHFVTPAGLHGWHWIHILLQKLFYLPILMAASWFGLRGTLLTAGAVSSVFVVHVLVDAFLKISYRDLVETAFRNGVVLFSP